MKKLLKNYKYIFIVVSILTLYNCGGGTIKGSNVVGVWYHSKSKMMGNYSISQTTVLNIIRNGPGDYEYRLETTTTDQMYGGTPKTTYSSGMFNNEVKNNNWRFSGGSFGERGGYIKVPSDNWDDYKPETITVNFGPNRGDPMVFSQN